jgi:DNA repair protein RecN (Recombination protein N)
MLRALGIRDFVIVKSLDLEFDPGFTVLTGETGAGKSILIEALSLALGARAETGIVRAGADRAEVSAEFEVPEDPQARDWLQENELWNEEGCMLRRTLDRAGRSRAYINGSPVTLQQLKTFSEWLLDIHGQHAHQSLQKATTQRELLDAYAGASDLARSVRMAWTRWQEAQKRLQEWNDRSGALMDERARLQDEVRELRALDVTPENWQALQTDHGRLANAGSLLEGARFAVEVLSESEMSCNSQLDAVVQKLDELAGFDPSLQNLRDLIESARIQVDEAAHALRRYGMGVEFDDAGLREAESRMERILTAARRYRVHPEQLQERLGESSARLEELAAMGSAEGLQKANEEAHADYLDMAAQLSQKRVEAACRLGGEVTASMAQLAMGKGRFEVVLTSVEAGTASGLEEVEFRVAAHSGQEPAPLARVASGGELSRISLAIQAALSAVAAVPTLIFDEVDTGIGGRVAEIVGRLLEDLGSRHQVLCVTHLPQVAARARHHFTVTKTDTPSGVNSTIHRLDDDARIEELARMLGGVSITDTTRRHAAEMLGR